MPAMAAGERIVDANALGLDKAFNALKDSRTRIIEVYSPTTRKENRVLKGAVKKIVADANQVCLGIIRALKEKIRD